MYKDNRIHIEGRVKRSCMASEPRPGIKCMNFCLVVKDWANDGIDVYIDCFANTEVSEALEEFVEQGEKLAIDGSLTFRTMTDHRGRRTSTLQVYIENVEELEN